MERIFFRCDGDERIGAGHVSRCLQIALAMRVAGVEVAFAGEYEGIAADLLAGAGIELVAPEPGRPAGIPAHAGAAVVDSYEIAFAEVEAAAQSLPVAFVADGPAAPSCTAVLTYHLDAARRIEIPAAAVAVTGAAYAPARPAAVTARRPRGLAHGLLTIGASRAGDAVLAAVAQALLALDGIELFIAADEPELAERLGPRVSAGRVGGGLLDRIAWADVAASGAGSTPYELACAGVPAVLIALADNQAPVASAFEAAGIAVSVDARDRLDVATLAAAVERLGDPTARAAMAGHGPAVVDGYGAFRARDALLAAFAGDDVPRVVTYRPATAADADLLRAWRNDPEVRSVSREQHEVTAAEHADWLERTLAAPDRSLLIAEAGGDPVATLRFDREGDEAEISVTVTPGMRGAGIGTQVIREATELELTARPGIARIVAAVHRGNPRSVAAFTGAGYADTGENDGDWLRLDARLPAWT